MYTWYMRVLYRKLKKRGNIQAKDTRTVLPSLTTIRVSTLLGKQTADFYANVACCVCYVIKCRETCSELQLYNKRVQLVTV